MPKVLQILNRLIIGGPSEIAVLLTKYLAPEYETLLVVGGKDKEEKNATHLADNLGITPYAIPEMRRTINPAQDYLAYKKIKKLIQEFKPDIVHTHAAKSGALGRLAARSCDVPVILHTFHGHIFHSYFNSIKSKSFVQIERYLATKSSGIIAISDIQKYELSSIYKITQPENISVIPLGLDLDKFQINKEEKRKKFRQFYKLQPQEIAVGIVGRIVAVKNHMMFLKVIKQILNKMPNNIRFFIIGDGDIRMELMNYLIENNIDFTYFPDQPSASTVTFTSWLTEMDTVFAGLDIVALTSLNEGTPVSLIEAQAAEKPVISTNVGGVKDIVQEHISGFITEVNDDNQFSSYLLQLLQNEDLRLKMGKAGKENAFSKYSYQRLIVDTKRLYSKLLNTSAE
jgi:glycosyltransferase involved in cell wall biosynthesis